MKLHDLFAPFGDFVSLPSANPEITGLTLDSRKIQPGYLFIALKGAVSDGADFIPQAIENGAVAVLLSSGSEASGMTDFVLSDDPRSLVSHIAARFYKDLPSHIVAVTGTNGKTSTAEFARQLFETLALKSASLGTIGVRSANINRYSSLTTPDPVSLIETLHELHEGGISHVALEASSHGLEQGRLNGLDLKAAAFTNLTRDHMDYHESEEAYFEAKAVLFNTVLPEKGVAVLNADIPQFPALSGICQTRGQRILSFGRKGQDLKLISSQPDGHGTQLALEVLGQRFEIHLPLVGAFQAMNALAALGLVLGSDTAFEHRLPALIEGLSKLQGAPGRLQLVDGHPAGAGVYVDYAHTPDALENILTALRPHTAGKLYCLFGCGGDRDPGKRPMMGEIAARLSDVAIVTDDNPRTEDPASIRKQIMAATKGGIEIGDRRQAIIESCAMLGAGDVLVVAGKGHEQGQIIGSTVEPFDDVDEVQAALSRLHKGEKSA